MTPFKPVLLIPCKSEYCVFKIKVDNLLYFPLVCTAKGTYVAALFHGQCVKCKTIRYPSYKVTNDYRHIFKDLGVVDDVGTYKLHAKQYFKRNFSMMYLLACGYEHRFQP